MIERKVGGYVALCPEFDLASQGEKNEQAKEHLREALELFFEAAPDEESARRMNREM